MRGCKRLHNTLGTPHRAKRRISQGQGKCTTFPSRLIFSGPSEMAKKKKTQLKPVVRGFATTSVPKKVVTQEDTPESSDAPVTKVDEDSKAKALPGQEEKPNCTQAAPDEFDPHKV